ncbi:MAG: hypothetical protein QW230_01720 [Thermofilum sp.]
MSGLLREPPEPSELKERLRALHKDLQGALGARGGESAVWVGMLLPSYLWRHWGEELKALGITWQDFLSLLRQHSRDIVSWALEGKLTWQELVRRIVQSIEGRRGADLLSYLAESEKKAE